jgi:cytochrome c-type biogenesis protein CcmF
MIPELGHYSLVLAGCLAVVASFSGLATARHPTYQRLVLSTTVGQCAFCVLAFVALVWSFAADDFSVAYVANHSNSLLPWYYKVSATWGGHEGSFLLWIAIMSAWMLALAIRSQNYPAPLVTRVLGVMALMNLGFICFALFTSNPFLRLIPMTPADGADLNPLLQDFGLIVHPPLLYAGYVGLAVPFAFAVAALLEGRVDAAWARWAKTWTNMAWALLTLGITLGSWWAYYELGWGGWWFWDPVENASFMPWLAATALVHSLAVTDKRGAFKSWTLLLAIAAFSLSLLGAFIVRSGVLTSVHSFAVDPERGLFILLFLLLVVGGSLTLYALRAGRVSVQVSYTLLSREFFMLVNNVILVISLAVVLWGTIAPLAYEAVTEAKISVGPPFFNAFYVPLGCALAAVLALLPPINWKRTDAARMRPALISGAWGLLVAVLLWFVLDPASLTVAAAVGVAAWVVLSHANDLLGKRKTLSRAYLGMSFAHVGFAVCIIGIAVTSTQSSERDVRMQPQDRVDLGHMEVTFLGVSAVNGPNYRAQQGTFVVVDGATSFTLRPEKRQYLAGGNVMTEAGIRAGLVGDTYIALGEPLDANEGAWAVRLHYKPLVRWIWLGALLMAFGGVVAILDRRYRTLRVRRQVASSAAVST